MLDVTLDLITQTASSSLFAFCFCNLIIVIILVGSKPGSEFGQEEKPAKEEAKATYEERERDLEDGEAGNENGQGFCEERSDLPVVGEVASTKRLLAAEGKCGGGGIEDYGDEEDVECNDDDGEDEDEDDDELRKRVEEFIEKVNREWKAELLKSSHL